MNRPYIPVHTALLVAHVDAYSDEGAEAKAKFHSQGKAFMRKLATALGLTAGTFDVRSNMGGIAVSGEVSLHSDDIYVQMSEMCMGEPGLSLLYRTCDSRKDCSGHQNNFISMRSLFSVDRQNDFVLQVRGMIDRVRESKRVAA